MNSKRKFLPAFGFALAALLLFALPVSAQNSSNPTAFLVYYEDDFELEVFDGSGDYIGEVFIGMELFPGSTIKTYNTSAEIQLDPNGSILKISENSVFQIEAFQTAPDESNDFSLFNGKLRVIAARAGLGYENYSIITQSAVCGVRGTDFVIDSIGVVAVKDGKVEFSSLLTGDTINVVAGQIADVFADTFSAVAASAQSLASVFGGMDFQGTDPAQVPGHTPVPGDAAADDDSGDTGDDGDKALEDESDDDQSTDDQSTDDQSTDEQNAEDGDDGKSEPDLEGDAEDSDSDGNKADDGTDEKSLDDTEGDKTVDDESADTSPVPSRTGSAAASITASTLPEGTDSSEDDADSGDTDKQDRKPGPLDGFFDRLGDIFEFEIGSINIDGTTYAKAVVQPEFEIGKLRASLYLPVIYQDNLFDPESWYMPAGNNEWSFGTDQTEPVDIAFDILNDLFLKIEYIQWGDNGDDFYLKFGNLDNMTIGHGMLMRNFTNNFEFPAVRKVGINTGFNFEKFGFEAVLDNAADPTIFGGRFVLIPFGSSFPMGLGLSAITDINPDSEIETSRALWDPMILNASIDLGLPIELLNLTLFADTGGLVLYKDNTWHTETFYNQDQPDFLTALNNYGISTGIFGELFTLEYRLEYRLSKGIFTPAFYGNNYLADKTSQYNALLDYIDSPSDPSYQDITMGVYGELAMNLFDAVIIGGGYYWPWEIDQNGNITPSEADFFSLSAELMPDVIPIVGLHGSVTYTRQGLAESIRAAVDGSEPFTLLNEDSLLAGELVYPFDPMLDIALQFATAFTRNEDGNLFVNEDGSLDTYFAMSIDMRIHF